MAFFFKIISQNAVTKVSITSIELIIDDRNINKEQSPIKHTRLKNKRMTIIFDEV